MKSVNNMKKLIIALVLLLPLVFSSCGKSTEETTGTETLPPVEITTAEPPSIEEMSPSYIDPLMNEDIEIRISDIDFDSFEEIEAKDSYFPDSSHDKILKSDKAQYFFVTDDIKIHAVFFDENERVFGSASYNTETGYIEFYGDADFTWYFNEDGELKCFVYTYSFNSIGSHPIYTFYTPDGKKDVTRTAEGWYSANLDLLTNEEIMEYLEKYEGTIESTAEYNSSTIAN